MPYDETQFRTLSTPTLTRFAATTGYTSGVFRTLTSGGPADTTPSAVTNPVPATSTALAAADPIGFDVTDLNLSTTSVFALFSTIGVMEVVYYVHPTRGAEFGPQYTGTVSVITGGIRFSNVKRVAGWPAAPTIIVDAKDSKGN